MRNSRQDHKSIGQSFFLCKKIGNRSRTRPLGVTEDAFKKYHKIISSQSLEYIRALFMTLSNVWLYIYMLLVGYPILNSDNAARFNNTYIRTSCTQSTSLTPTIMLSLITRLKLPLEITLHLPDIDLSTTNTLLSTIDAKRGTLPSTK